MTTAADRKIILVTRKTRLEDLMVRHHSLSQVRFYLEHLGADFSDYLNEHETYLAAREKARVLLSSYPRRQIVERPYLQNFLFGPDDIVIALGQDGLVANTMKYLNGQPLIGINPDPSRYEGILLPFQIGELDNILSDVIRDKRAVRSVTMAKAVLSDRQTLYAVNDFFIGPRSHVSARYEISLGGFSETQSSSGIIVSTGLGSTAWIKSIVTGALMVAQGTASAGYTPLPWNTDKLIFAVREPFPSPTSQANIVFGTVAQTEEMCLRSLMPEGGVIFSDGIEMDFMEFNAGTEARITVADRTGSLVQ